MAAYLGHASKQNRNLFVCIEEALLSCGKSQWLPYDVLWLCNWNISMTSMIAYQLDYLISVDLTGILLFIRHPAAMAAR